MNSSQLVHAGHSMALLQNSVWSLLDTRCDRGSRLLYKDLLIKTECLKRSPRFFELSIPRFGQGVVYRRSQSRCTGRVSSSRKDYGNISSLERLVRRTVKSEKEQKEEEEEGMKEEEPKSVAITPTHTQVEVVLATARGVLMTARIFTSMMTWVFLFFMASVCDGESQSFKDPGNKNGKRGPRR